MEIIEIWFYVSSYMEHGGILDKPSVATGVVWIIYLFDAIVTSLLARYQVITDSNAFLPLFLSLLVFSFIPGYFFIYHYLKKKNRGLKILAKYRQRIKKKRYIVLIWLLYFCIIIPAICVIIIKI